jgi:hypothetical protein
MCNSLLDPDKCKYYTYTTITSFDFLFIDYLLMSTPTNQSRNFVCTTPVPMDNNLSPASRERSRIQRLIVKGVTKAPLRKASRPKMVNNNSSNDIDQGLCRELFPNGL